MQFLLALWLGGMAAAAPTVYRSDSVLVRAVLDGGTIQVSTYGRVRLLGLAQPAGKRGPAAAEAREALAALVLHRWVHLEQEGERIDADNRHLAYVVRDDGLFVNAELVRRGLARVETATPVARLPELTRAEAEARSLRRGLWAQAPTSAAGVDPTVTPKRPRRYTSGSSSGSSGTRKKKKKS